MLVKSPSHHRLEVHSRNKKSITRRSEIPSPLPTARNRTARRFPPEASGRASWPVTPSGPPEGTHTRYAKKRLDPGTRIKGKRGVGKEVLCRAGGGGDGRACRARLGRVIYVEAQRDSWSSSRSERGQLCHFSPQMRLGFLGSCSEAASGRILWNR